MNLHHAFPTYFLKVRSILLTLLRPDLTCDLFPSCLLSYTLHLFMFLYDPQKPLFPLYLFAYIHSGPLKVGWSPGKKKFRAPDQRRTD